MTTQDNLTAKQSLRREMKARLQTVDLTALSLTVQTQLVESLLFQAASTLLSYAALPDEVELTPLVAAWPSKQWYFPKVQDTDIAFYPIQALNELSMSNHWGIREPSVHLDPWQGGTHREQTLLLVPGRAFSISGQRLGRGKGFYDRFLSQFQGQFITVGVAPWICIQEIIPCEPWDQSVDYLLSEKGLTQAKQR